MMRFRWYKRLFCVGLALCWSHAKAAVELVNNATESSSDQDFDQLRSQRMAAIYERVQIQVLKAEAAFSEQIKGKLQKLGSYSSKVAGEFNDFLSQDLRSFVGSMNIVERSANSDYYMFLEQYDRQSDDPRNLTPDERLLLNGVHQVTQLAITHVRSLILDLTSKVVKDQMGIQIAEAFQESDAQAERDYQQQREENERGLDRTWWQSVKESGLDLLGDFSDQFKKAVKEEVFRQTEQAIDKAAGAALGAAAKSTIDAFRPLIGSAALQLTQLSEKLSHKGLSELMRDTSDVALKSLKVTIRYTNPVIKPTHSVTIQTGLGLGAEEQSFLKNRMPRVQKVLKKEFGIDAPLRIAWCFSGGGNRALFMTRAMLASAAQHKFLDASLYLTGLSGSTWLIAPWSYLYLKGYLSKNLEKSFDQMLQSLELSLNDKSMIAAPKTDIFGPPLLKEEVVPSFSHDIAMRFAYNQTITAVDIYGALVGNFALQKAGKKRLDITWSSVALQAQQGIIPWPLCSSIFDLKQRSVMKSREHTEYEWFETGPSQAGSPVLGYIPIQYLGSTFKDGKLVVDLMCPEYSMAFYLGIYGSAFAFLSPNGVIDKGLPEAGFTVQGREIKIPIDEWVRKIIDENFGSKARSYRPEIIHAQLPNYSVGVLSSLLQNETTFGMFDGGIDFNFPLPLLFDRPERTPDVVFIGDSNNGDVPAFKDAAAYFKRKGITTIPDLSKVTKAGLLSSAMTVFNDPRDSQNYNSHMSTLIYFPTRNIDTSPGSPYFTPNFKYSSAQIKVLSDNIQGAFDSQVPEIKKILRLVAQQRYGSQALSEPAPESFINMIGSRAQGLRDRLSGTLG